jgi:hypothetical protein
LAGHDHPNKPANGKRMIRQSMPSGLTRGCGRFGDWIMRPLINGARSDAKPDPTFADRALEMNNGIFQQVDRGRALERRGKK